MTYCSKRLPEDNINNGESKTKNDFDAANDKALLTKIHTYSSSGSKLPPVTDELIKNQTEAHSKSRKLSAHLLCRSLCPTSSTGSNGASSNDNANTMMSPKAASAADMMRLPIGVAKERVGGKRKALKIVLLGPHTTICVLILLYMCHHTTIRVLILLYMCPHATICVLILPYASSSCYICVLILECVLSGGRRVAGIYATSGRHLGSASQVLGAGAAPCASAALPHSHHTQD